MSTTTAITIQLEQEDYDRLVAEAKRRGVEPDTLAGEIVHDMLADRHDSMPVSDRTQTILEALEELGRITAKLPPVDAVAIARESREELERRPDITWPSS